jgi:hypothetical protein
MPQCQRSPNRTILLPEHERAAGLWVCPGHPYSPACPGGEAYVDVSRTVLARDCLFDAAIARCDAEFGPSANDHPRLWVGVSPLTVRNENGSIDIYLEAGSNRDQYRHQCAHEVFHARCGPDTMHWTHELLAVHFSLLHLRAEGYEQYARVNESDLERDAALIGTPQLLAWNGWPTYPPTPIFGRVFVLGRELINAASWADVKRLVSGDLSSWLASLGRPARRRAQRILAA